MALLLLALNYHPISYGYPTLAHIFVTNHLLKHSLNYPEYATSFVMGP